MVMTATMVDFVCNETIECIIKDVVLTAKKIICIMLFCWAHREQLWGRR